MVFTLGAKYTRDEHLMHLARQLLLTSERNIVSMLGQSKISSFFTASSQKRTHSNDDNAANVSYVGKLYFIAHSISDDRSKVMEI